MKRSRVYPILAGLTRSRSIGAVVLTLLLVLVLGPASAIMSAAISLAATTALINGASGLPDPAKKPGYIPAVADHLLAPNTSCNAMTNPSCILVPVNGPETIWPFIGGLGGLTFDVSVAEGLKNLNLEYEAVRAADPTGTIVIFGYSQSGDIVTKQLRAIAKDPNRPPADQLEFLIVGNTNRPNGGILSRFTPLYIPIFNASFDGPTPSDTGYAGTDIAFHYDGIADFPMYPINLLAVVNALAGFLTIHTTYPQPNPALGEYTQAEFQAAMADPANRQTHGGTTYITLPIKNLPIFNYPRMIAARTNTWYFVEPLLDLVEPALTVLIELGYDRSIPYGDFTTVRPFPIIDPVKLGVDLVAAAFQGVGEAIQDLVSPTPPPPELINAPLIPGVLPGADLFQAPIGPSTPQAPITSTPSAPSLLSAASVPESDPVDDPAPVSDLSSPAQATVNENGAGTDPAPVNNVVSNAGDSSDTPGSDDAVQTTSANGSLTPSSTPTTARSEPTDAAVAATPSEASESSQSANGGTATTSTSPGGSPSSNGESTSNEGASGSKSASSNEGSSSSGVSS